MMTKYYVVRNGKKPGIYDSRDECKDSVSGFSDAKYKSFKSKSEADQARKGSYDQYYQTKEKKDRKTGNFLFEKNSIAVDAACSGNPGALEYKGIDLPTGKILFHKKFPLGTNNIGEFLAIIEGLHYLEKHKSDQYLYSDSKHAISRISQQKCKTKLEKSPGTEGIFEEIHRAEEWLRHHKLSTKILKRETSERGEIPADFGRK